MSSVHITTGDGKSTEYDEEQVRSMLQQGSLRDDALYWREGMSDWQSIQGLFPGLVTSRRGASAVSREAAVAEYTFTKNPFGLTRVLKVMLWVQLGVVVLSILSDFGQLSLVAGGDFTVEAAEANDFRQSMVGILNFGVFIVAAVIFAQWIYRANLNCQGFGAEGMEFTPGWSVGYYFIPFLNLVRPYQSMKEIWNVSRNPRKWQSQPGSSILGWWWGLWIVSHGLGNVSFRMNMNVDSPSSLEAATMVSIVSSLVEVALILVAMVMVSSIIAKQSKLTKTKS